MGFAELCDEYLQRGFRADPVRASRAGVRGYDHLLPDVTEAGLTADRAEVERLLAACAAQEPDALTASEQLDLRCMQVDLEDALLEHELAPWDRDPLWYVTQVADGLNALVEQVAAPAATGDPSERAAALTARLRAGSGLLDLARQRLQPDQVPPLWVDMAREAVSGTQRLLEEALPRFTSAMTGSFGDTSARGAGAGAVAAGDEGVSVASVHAAADAARSALARYDAFLERLAGRATGQYAVGSETFSRILRRRHLIDLDSDALYDWGRRMVEQYENEAEAAGRRIDPNRHWTDIMEEIKDDYPPADGWLEAFQANMATSRQHLIDHDLVTIPDGESCRMIWTPPHMRATHPLGGMDVSAPFTDDLESRFFVTPNDESAPPERQLEHHRDLNHAFLRSIALHEVYPGHHLQAVHAKQGQSRVRRWQRSTTLVEGWGLYTETLMHETGYLDDPKVQLIYAKNSLWRAVRVVVDVGLHARGMTFQEAVTMMQERLKMEGHMAAGEVRRYTLTPTYQSSYLLGRTAILELRSAYEDRLGSRFTLKRFHDRLLSYGSIPVTLIRQAMLDPRGEDRSA